MSLMELSVEGWEDGGSVLAEYGLYGLLVGPLASLDLGNSSFMDVLEYARGSLSKSICCEMTLRFPRSPLLILFK